jgi:hypothetical protein
VSGSRPTCLVFGWRQASFAPQQLTGVHVSFEPVGPATRVTVEHFGWDTVPGEHVAKHGFPEAVFLRRHAEWWQALLGSFKGRARQERRHDGRRPASEAAKSLHGISRGNGARESWRADLVRA